MSLVDKSVWKEKRNRTVSQWINQSEMKPFRRVRKRDKPVWQEEQLTYKHIRLKINFVLAENLDFLLLRFGSIFYENFYKIVFSNRL